MRVIAGKYRGLKLASFEGENIRPTIDRVKESVFNILQFDIQGKKVLDLFAGTGSLGIEAISRGAKKVTFVEVNEDSIKVLKQNLKRIEEDYELLKQDYKVALSQKKTQKESYDFIFLDPPYKTSLLKDALKEIDSSKLLNAGGVIIAEHLFDDKLEIELENLEIYKEKKYGTVAVTFLKER